MWRTEEADEVRAGLRMCVFLFLVVFLEKFTMQTLFFLVEH